MTRNVCAYATSVVIALGLLGCDDSQGRGQDNLYRDNDDGDDDDRTYRDYLVDQVRARADQWELTSTAPAPPVSEEMFELGQALSFDKILSGNKNISCMTCHHPFVGSDDDRSLPAGEGGVGLGTERTGGPIIPRNAPALFNLHTFETMFWDSRVEPDPGSPGHFLSPAGSQLTPEMQDTFTFGITAAQAMFPVTSREEMRGEHDDGTDDNELGDIDDGAFQGIWSGLMARLGEIEEYRDMFEAAYPNAGGFDNMTFAHAANAIAAFEIAGFEATQSPWDRFLAGDDDAMTIGQLQGAKTFFDVGCIGCHNGPGLSDFGHHNIALPQIGPGKGNGSDGTDDFGRERVTAQQADRYAFRTPILTNTALTGPWGHDGQYADLTAFLDHYERPAEALENYDVRVEVDQENLWELDNTRTDEILATLSPFMDELKFSRRRWIKNAQIRRLERFMGALTDPASTQLSSLVPERVPSGLPVED